MPIDWTHKPVPFNARTKRIGIASVAEVKGGWRWIVWFRDRRGAGVEATEDAARLKASQWIDLQLMIELGKEPTQ